MKQKMYFNFECHHCTWREEVH